MVIILRAMSRCLPVECFLLISRGDERSYEKIVSRCCTCCSLVPAYIAQSIDKTIRHRVRLRLCRLAAISIEYSPSLFRQSWFWDQCHPEIHCCHANIALEWRIEYPYDLSIRSKLQGLLFSTFWCTSFHDAARYDLFASTVHHSFCPSSAESFLAQTQKFVQQRQTSAEWKAWEKQQLPFAASIKMSLARPRFTYSQPMRKMLASSLCFKKWLERKTKSFEPHVVLPTLVKLLPFGTKLTACLRLLNC